MQNSRQFDKISELAQKIKHLRKNILKFSQNDFAEKLVIELRNPRFGALDARAEIILGVRVEVDYTRKVAEGLYVT